MKQLQQIIHEARTQLQPPPTVQVILIVAMALAILLVGNNFNNK
jgi:hypothetical protein